MKTWTTILLNIFLFPVGVVLGLWIALAGLKNNPCPYGIWASICYDPNWSIHMAWAIFLALSVPALVIIARPKFRSVIGLAIGLILATILILPFLGPELFNLD